MKKILTLLSALIIVTGAFSQTYYNYNFYSGFPAGFVTWNLDGQTCNTSFTTNYPPFTALNGAGGAGWIVYPATGSAAQPNDAYTCSEFTNTGTAANRWLVTPRMTIPSGVPNVALIFSAFSADNQALESYNVMISTTGDSATTAFSTSPYLLQVSGETGAAPHVIGLAAYAGQSVRIAFQCVSLNKFVLGIQDIQLVNLPSYSIKVNDVEMYEHNYLGNGATVTGTFTNTGFDTLTSVTMNYQVPGQPVVSATLSGTLLPQGSYYYSNTTTPFNPSTAATYPITVSFSGLNGTNPNAAPAADTSATVNTFFYAQTPGLVKNVVIEEMTGAGCPWCPGGALAMRDAYDAHRNFVIPVAIHSTDINDMGVSPSDAFQIVPGQDLVDTVCTGFPTAMVGRLFTFDNNALVYGVQTNDGQYGTYQGTQAQGFTYIWDTLASFSQTMATPVNVSLTNSNYTTGATSVTVTVNASFLNTLTQGHYNMNLYLVEDSVLTPSGNNGNGYTQDNAAYSGQASSGSSELYSLGTPLLDDGLPNHWAQNHVLRAMAGGPWGVGGDIPSAPQAGMTYSHTFTVPITAGYRPDYLHLVGMVQEWNSTNYNLRTILNASEMWLVTPTGITTTKDLNKLYVYPNPANTTANVALDLNENAMVTLSVVNAMGQVVVTPADNLLNAGEHTVKIYTGGLATGLYFVKVSVNGTISTLPLSINNNQ